MIDEFNSRVQRQIERLQRCTYQAIETEVAQKRRAWFQHNPVAAQFGHPTPRQAFDLLFFDYMGLSPDDLRIVSETETEIVWHSANPCPTLEAVKALGLDTRSVCRAAYEKSTQAFVSQLDPQLRFLRSYDEIRPYAGYCRESIIRVDFEALLRLALEEAQASRQEGNQGYGAVIALGRRVLARARDTAVTQRDPGLHAEVNAVRQAAQVLGDDNLSGAILFSTCEPCPLCSALARQTNLTSIVYGVPLEETAQPGEGRIRTCATGSSEDSPALIEIIGGILQEECRALYRQV